MEYGRRQVDIFRHGRGGWVAGSDRDRRGMEIVERGRCRSNLRADFREDWRRGWIEVSVVWHRLPWSCTAGSGMHA